uniref:Uncharacterized protein n=1 Tax=Meloidogyne enterolobii TaxID=390850 RepID=A0A6V7UR06_MELEN|nr:unnamed protein product [Meloidogyne enterolobii]
MDLKPTNNSFPSVCYKIQFFNPSTFQVRSVAFYYFVPISFHFLKRGKVPHGTHFGWGLRRIEGDILTNHSKTTTRFLPLCLNKNPSGF